MDIDLLLCSGGVCFLAACVQTPQLFAKSLSLVLLIVSVFYLRIVCVRNKKHAIPARKCLLSGKYPPPNLPATTQPVTTPKVDSLITEVISFSLRDFVFSWLAPPLVTKTQKVSDIATSLSWQIVYLTQMKLNEVDFTTLVSQDIMIKLHSHFKTIRDTCPKDIGKFTFKEYIDPSEEESCCLGNTKSCCHGNEEKRFLKDAAIVVLLAITPRSIWLSPLFTDLMGDVLSNYVLYPLTLKVTDPYYLYSCIIPYIGTIGSPIKRKKFFTQAKTYEEFIKKINKETDLNKLRQLRYKVIAEIMQAMTIENLKQDEDFDGLLSQINSKSYRLSTRNLARYINQCKVAKVTCEKRIHDVTRLQKRAPHYADMRFKDSETKLLELDEIMHSPYVLPFFVQYLEKQKDYGPLKLWLVIEQCKPLEKRPEELYPLIKEGYLDHLTVTSPLRAHQVSRHLVRMAEAYVEHKSGYWQFIYEIQEELYTMLLEQHYKPFLISSQYMQYVCATECRRGTVHQDVGVSCHVTSDSEGAEEAVSEDFSKINSLKEELKSKEVLLETLDIMNYCSVEELRQLEEEIQNLSVTINQLEHHSEKASIWWEFLGKWEASVDAVETSSTSSTPSEPLYTILVRQKIKSCQQILPFSDKSHFRLTQFNLNKGEQDQSSNLLCICANRRRRSKRGRSQASPTKSRSGSSSTRESATKSRSGSSTTRESATKSRSGSSSTRESATNRGRGDSEPERERADSEEQQRPSSYESLTFEHSYRSLKPHSMLLSNSEDSTSQDNISTNSLIMFTPVDAGITQGHYSSGSVSEPESRDEEECLPLLFEPIEVGNSLFYTPSSLTPSHTQPLSLVYTSSIASDQLSLSSEATLADTILDLEPHQSDGRSVRTSLDELDTLSDSDTISASSQDRDFSANFMFDDIFCRSTRSNSDASVPDLTSLQDSPSTKVRQYLSLYAADDLVNVPLDPNQSDDDKIRILSLSRSSNNTSICIEEEDPCSDSSLEDTDPYLVVDIQSLPIQTPAAQLVDGSNQNQEEHECLLRQEEDEEEDDEEEIETGWIITHTLDDIRSLYLNLRGCKSAGYPSSFPVSSPKEDQLQDNKEQVDDFLNFVLRDRILSQSEFVYRFFNPSCEQLYRSTQSKQKNTELTEDEKNKDSIAIPFYTLLGEIFEIHGHLQWLRRQIMYLVRITFGSTIERQIYRAMSWAGSEQQVFWYIQCFRGTMWGDYPPCNMLSDPVKREEMRGRVRMCLLNTPPQLLVVLFGSHKTKKGLGKILDTMEGKKHGKHCMYTIIELISLHIIGTSPDRGDRLKSGTSLSIT